VLGKKIVKILQFPHQYFLWSLLFVGALSRFNKNVVSKCGCELVLKNENIWLKQVFLFFAQMFTEIAKTTRAGVNGDVNSVVWAYLICGVYLFVVGIIFFLLALAKTERNVRSGKTGAEESRGEDSVKRVAGLFILVCIYYFFCVAGETAYNSYIYSVSICSDLNFSVSFLQRDCFNCWLQQFDCYFNVSISFCRNSKVRITIHLFK